MNLIISNKKIFVTQFDVGNMNFLKLDIGQDHSQ